MSHPADYGIAWTCCERHNERRSLSTRTMSVVSPPSHVMRAPCAVPTIRTTRPFVSTTSTRPLGIVLDCSNLPASPQESSRRPQPVTSVRLVHPPARERSLCPESDQQEGRVVGNAIRTVGIPPWLLSKIRTPTRAAKRRKPREKTVRPPACGSAYPGSSSPGKPLMRRRCATPSRETRERWDDGRGSCAVSARLAPALLRAARSQAPGLTRAAARAGRIRRD